MEENVGNLGFSISGKDLLASATVLETQRRFDGGIAELAEAKVIESKSGHPTLRLDFISSLDDKKGIYDYLRTSTAKDLYNSFNRIKYGIVYSNNETAKDLLSEVNLPIMYVDKDGNQTAEPVGKTFMAEANGEGKFEFDTKAIGEFLKESNESIEDFDYIQIKGSKEVDGNTMPVRTFVLAKVHAPNAEKFCKDVQEAFNEVIGTEFEVRVGKDERNGRNYTNVKKILSA